MAVDDGHRCFAVPTCVLWTRGYAYANDSNRLSGTTVGVTTSSYTHDAAGNMTAMPGLGMTWDFASRMIGTDKGAGTVAYYHYDAGGQRVRKVSGQIIDDVFGATKQTIYLGGYEFTQQLAGHDVTDEWQTLNISDDHQTIARLETRTIEDGDATSADGVWRFQLADHLGSCTVELTIAGVVLGREEFYPYGASAYSSQDSGAGVSQKRYRFNGKEKDSESGLYYYGARYYAPWLGRWASADPTPTVGRSDFEFCSSNPVGHVDPDGREDKGFFAQLWSDAKKEWSNYVRPLLRKDAEEASTRYAPVWPLGSGEGPHEGAGPAMLSQALQNRANGHEITPEDSMALAQAGKSHMQGKLEARTSRSSEGSLGKAKAAHSPTGEIAAPTQNATLPDLGLSNRGTRPAPGTRTVQGYVQTETQHAELTIWRHTDAAGQPIETFRFGPGPAHGIDGPHVHPLKMEEHTNPVTKQTHKKLVDDPRPITRRDAAELVRAQVEKQVRTRQGRKK